VKEIDLQKQWRSFALYYVKELPDGRLLVILTDAVRNSFEPGAEAQES
jgi:hypothetical protein